MLRTQIGVLIYCANCYLLTNRATVLGVNGRCESCDSSSWDRLFVPQFRLSDPAAVIKFRIKMNNAYLSQVGSELDLRQEWQIM
jgi:hypothetical protein